MVLKNKCFNCNKIANWVRYTQFSGNHLFCNYHAKIENDFLKCDSYKYWDKLKMKSKKSKQELYVNEIAKRRRKITKYQKYWDKLERELQKKCKHINLTKIPGANIGNYDPSADSYWYDFECYDCGKKWREKQ